MTAARHEASPAPPAGDRQADFIGADDLQQPYWATVDSAVASAPLTHVAAAVPRILRAVVSGAWRESRAVTSVLAVLHAVSGGLVSFGLLATADVVVELLAAGAGPESVVAALPALALVIASFGGVALLDSAVRALRGILLPRIELAARDRLYAAVSAVDLVAFDDADFAELVRRATAHGPSCAMARTPPASSSGQRCPGPRPSSPPGSCTRCLCRSCCCPRCRRVGQACGRLASHTRHSWRRPPCIAG